MSTDPVKTKGPAPEMTPEQVEQLAQACSERPEVYGEFVKSLTSPPETYNLTDATIGGLIEALHRLNPASLELDHFKRVMTYGEKIRINPPASYHGSHPRIRAAHAANLSSQPLTEEQRNHLLLVHGILGKITEALELAPLLVTLLSDKGDFDAINLVEELGDDAFYTALVEQAITVPRSSIVFYNVRKLAKRYKGGVFTVDEAFNRDLAEERVALGETPQ